MVQGNGTGIGNINVKNLSQRVDSGIRSAGGVDTSLHAEEGRYAFFYERLDCDGSGLDLPTGELSSIVGDSHFESFKIQRDRIHHGERRSIFHLTKIVGFPQQRLGQ